MDIPDLLHENWTEGPVEIIDYSLDSPENNYLESTDIPLIINGFYADSYVGSVWLDKGFQRYSAVQVETLFEKENKNAVNLAKLESHLVPTPIVPNSVTVTIAICTADRPESLSRALEAVIKAKLQCAKVLVVDNSRTQSDETKQVVDKFSASYVRELLPGLDRARNRALKSCDSEIVVFTDDDVEPYAGWDAWLLDCFTDPLVMVSCGLVLPATLENESCVESERLCSHSRGYWPTSYNVPLHYLDESSRSRYQSSPGVGANFAVRRDFALSLGGFPEELDAGMPSGTGGDTYLFGEVTFKGYRLEYTPRAIVKHWHRSDRTSLVKVYRANYTGVWCLCWRYLISDRRTVFAIKKFTRTAQWLVINCFRTLTRSEKHVPFYLLKEEVFAGLGSLSAYLKSRRIIKSRELLINKSEHDAPAPWLDRFVEQFQHANNSVDQLPRLSVVIPTRHRAEWVAELVESALKSADVFEVIVSVDEFDGVTKSYLEQRFNNENRLQVVIPFNTGNTDRSSTGAAATRNRGSAKARGEVILFLDDDVLPLTEETYRAHLLAHYRFSGSVVVGPPLADLRSVPKEKTDGRNWWTDLNMNLLEREALTWMEVCTGNLSVLREDFEKIGGFSDLPRREDWHFGLRAKKAGLNILGSAAAAVVQRDASVGSNAQDSFLTGYSDAMIAQEFPEYFKLVCRKEFPIRSKGIAKFVLFPFTTGESGSRFADILLRLSGMLPMERSKIVMHRAVTLSLYWCGVSSAVGGYDQARKLYATVSDLKELSPNLANSILDASYVPFYELAQKKYFPPRVSAGIAVPENRYRKKMLCFLSRMCSSDEVEALVFRHQHRNTS